LLSSGLEEVASYFEKKATTCTDPVRIKIPVESTKHKTAFGRFCVWTRRKQTALLSSGLEEVASYFEKIATTCTDPVRIKIPVESTKAESGYLILNIHRRYNLKEWFQNRSFLYIAQ